MSTLVRPDGSVLKGRAAIDQAYARCDPDRLTQHLVCNQQVTRNLLDTPQSWRIRSRRAQFILYRGGVS